MPRYQENLETALEPYNAIFIGQEHNGKRKVTAYRPGKQSDKENQFNGHICSTSQIYDNEPKRNKCLYQRTDFRRAVFVNPITDFNLRPNHCLIPKSTTPSNVIREVIVSNVKQNIFAKLLKCNQPTGLCHSAIITKANQSDRLPYTLTILLPQEYEYPKNLQTLF